ncbi:MAG: CHAT domain-containing protein [Ardenticatenaceae bacterium]|nr:CHAT domain-containing protein [Ardenticatenaceae bacterium]
MSVDRKTLTKLRKFLLTMDDENAMKAACFLIGINWDSFQSGGYQEKLLTLIDRLRMKPFLYEEFIPAIADERPDLDWQPFGGPAPQTPEIKPIELPPSDSEAREEKEEVPKFVNFSLLITGVGANQYFVQGSHNHEGGAGANGVRSFDLENADVQAALKYLSFLAAETSDVKKLGQILFNFLFPRSIYSVFSNLYTEMLKVERGVRIRLQIEAPELNHLPWEFIYNEENDEFLARNPLTPVVRFLERGYKPRSLVVDEVLRILVVVASPQNQTQLDAQDELRQLQNALEGIKDRVRIDLLDRATKEKLRFQVSTNRYDVVHYIGHGDFKDGVGYLLLEDEQRQADRMPIDLLKTAFRNRGIKIAVLNACNTASTAVDAPAFASVAQGLVSAEIPAVFAMQTKIPDYLSAKVTRLLYSYVAFNQPLDQVITEMRIGVAIQAREEHQTLWGTPVLYLQPPNGTLWSTPPPKLPNDLVKTLSWDQPVEMDHSPTLAERLRELQPAVVAAADQLNQFVREDVIENMADAVVAADSPAPDWKRVLYKLQGVVRDFANAEMALPADLSADLQQIQRELAEK